MSTPLISEKRMRQRSLPLKKFSTKSKDKNNFYIYKQYKISHPTHFSGKKKIQRPTQ